MDRIRKTLILLAIVAAPAAAQSFFVGFPGPCFSAGGSTFQISPAAAAPDYRVKIGDQSARPDLRMQLVDAPEAADFVLVDDFNGGNGNVCKGSTPIKTIKVDSEERAPDVTVSLSDQFSSPDYKIYVRSTRFSGQDAAALFAVIWKLGSNRKIAERH